MESTFPTLCKQCVALFCLLCVARVEVKETRPSGLWFGLGFEPMTFCQAVLSSYLQRQPGGGVTNDSLGGRIFLVDDLNGVGTETNNHATHK